MQIWAMVLLEIIFLPFDCYSSFFALRFEMNLIRLFLCKVVKHFVERSEILVKSYRIGIEICGVFLKFH